MGKKACLWLCLVLSCQTFAQSQIVRCPQGLHKSGEYLVRYWERPPAPLSILSFNSQRNIQPDKVLFRSGSGETPSAMDWPNVGVMRERTEAAMLELAQHPDIATIEENCYVQKHTTDAAGSLVGSAVATLVPNDPSSSKQWSLPVIHAPEAWSMTTGRSNVIVAVLDSGIDIWHTDLQDNIWMNEKEAKGQPGIDDDGNGYVDDIYGYNFAEGNSNPFPGPDFSDAHGTHIAGIIGAKGNNGIGVAGLNWNVQLMSVRVFPSSGQPTVAEMLAGVYYAVNNGARIINCSWGGVGVSTQAENQAFAYALYNNVLPVVSAGNDSLDSSRSTPANIPGVFVVGASSDANDLAHFSNYGNGVQILAPGTQIYSTIPNSQYAYMTGTSMAAPFVAGAAALLLAMNPAFSQFELQQILTLSAQKLNVTTSPGHNSRTQYPLLDLAAALRLARQRLGQTAELQPGTY